jgi:hypothetical protein
VGNIGGGVMNAGIAQTFSLSSHAAGIDAGIAHLVFSGYGAGWSNDYAQLEVRYYNAAGTQIGTTQTSNRANTDKTWTKMTSDTVVPALTRSVELRATMNRSGGNATDAGVDALTARLSYPLVPVVNVSATDTSASEPGSNTATFTITRAGLNQNSPLTVFYNTSGTATAGSDYSTLPGSVTMAAGVTSATVTLTPLDDTQDENDETVTLTLVGKAEYVLGSATSATATIVDNDLPPVTITATDAIATEAGETSATFLIERLTDALSQPLSVNYTRAGTAGAGDIYSLSGVATIPANQTTAVVTLTPVNDASGEHDETVNLSLASSSSSTISRAGNSTATIVNDDFPKVTITAKDAAASETGNDTATFTISRTKELRYEDLTVYFDITGTAILGQDFTLPAAGVTIPEGKLSTTVTITPLADSLIEGQETVTLTLLSNGGYAAGSPATATAKIADVPPASPAPNAAPNVTDVFVAGSQWSTSFKQQLSTLGLGDLTLGYRLPDAPVQPETLPWNNVNQVSIRFSENVSVQQNDLAVRGVAQAVLNTSGFAYNAATFTATWTFASPLGVPPDKLLLDLDGDSANAVTDSLNAPLAGGDVKVRVNVLPGDVDRLYQSVNSADLVYVRARQNTTTTSSLYDIYSDVDGSGTINTNDLIVVRNLQGTLLPTGEPQ